MTTPIHEAASKAFKALDYLVGKLTVGEFTAIRQCVEYALLSAEAGEEGHDYDPMADMINANRDAILEKHNEAVQLIRGQLATALSDKSGLKYTMEKSLLQISAILDALLLFHPMYCESWEGWPKPTND